MMNIVKQMCAYILAYMMNVVYRKGAYIFAYLINEVYDSLWIRLTIFVTYLYVCNLEVKLILFLYLYNKKKSIIQYINTKQDLNFQLSFLFF